MLAANFVGGLPDTLGRYSLLAIVGDAGSYEVTNATLVLSLSSFLYFQSDH